VVGAGAGGGLVRWTARAVEAGAVALRRRAALTSVARAAGWPSGAAAQATMPAGGAGMTWTVAAGCAEARSTRAPGLGGRAAGGSHQQVAGRGLPSFTFQLNLSRV